jgi:hypothetical protein
MLDHTFISIRVMLPPHLARYLDASPPYSSELYCMFLDAIQPLDRHGLGKTAGPLCKFMALLSDIQL